MKFTLEIPDKSIAISLSIVRRDKDDNLILAVATFDITEADGKKLVVPEESGKPVEYVEEESNVGENA